MIDIVLDGVSGMEAIHDQLSQALQFPSFYGRNLDALYDCMTEVRTNVTIHLKNLSALGRRGPALQILLQKAALLNSHIQLEME